MTNRAKPREVVVVLYDGVELLDVAGPANVLSAATRLGSRRGYRVRLVSARGGLVRTEGGVELGTRRWSALRGRFDTLVIPGGVRAHHQAVDAGAVRRLAARADRVIGVCTGAILLADAGLLSGRRAVTHWRACGLLRQRAPDCVVEDDAIFVRDAHVWTSAGVTAGMDLALAIVEHDHGPELALEVARWLVMPLRRHGGQSQFSASLAAQRADHGPIREVMRWASDNLRDDLRVGSLARRAGMSPRNFARRFAAETGATPAAWVERVRLEAARGRLEGSTRSVREIASLAGYRNAATMHRAFQRHLALTPQQYRARFSIADAPSTSSR